MAGVQMQGMNGMTPFQQPMMYGGGMMNPGFVQMMPSMYYPMMMPGMNQMGMMPMNNSDPNLPPYTNNQISTYGAGNMPKSYSQQQFNTIDNRKDDHYISLKNKKQVGFTDKKNVHNRHNTLQPYGRDYDDELENQMYNKPQRKFWTFEDFKEHTLPKLQLRKIVKIQALLRGAFVRKRRWPKLVLWHQGSVRYTDSLIDHYIEDIFIPDLVLEILTKNRVYENVDLYSDENKILYQIRADMIEKVVRQMTKETVKVAQDQIVNEYLNKRFRTKTIDEQDPMRRVVTEMMDKVMKSITRDIAKERLGNVVFDYLIEAQFIGFFNNYYIRREVEHTVKDAIEDLAVGEVIEDLCDRIILEAVPIIAQGELNAEIKRQDKMEINYAFGEYLDRCVLEIIIQNLSKLYEDEDREINIREQTDKRRRDEIRSKSQAAKIEDDEFERMTQMNRSLRSRQQSAASRRSYNSQLGAYNMGNPNVRDRYKADYPGGDPDFNQSQVQQQQQQQQEQVQPEPQPVVVEEKKEEPKKSGGFFGLFKKKK
ncbi:iq calmodulin-binding motif family protein [Stylonychia lemnae]|uniref:Iq calmodulin-binding motif family protein n=1 Tax=Stylonychia lemnae TaxID=5949 RepID=A0A078ANW7_STYLE|nr:iq calmodulin-binding motif family protein [Stylonychia lemnae]|eukprot:CDW83626.1 iq calmodulin-binding motif family protein [Stylonychia lemnae]